METLRQIPHILQALRPALVIPIVVEGTCPAPYPTRVRRKGPEHKSPQPLSLPASGEKKLAFHASNMQPPVLQGLPPRATNTIIN